MATMMEEMRARREARMAKNKAQVEGGGFEYLNVAALPEGVNLWWEKEVAQELQIRILPFQVTVKNNCGGDEVGDFASVREIKTHFNMGAGGRTILCPTTFGKPCPICEHYYKFSEDERKQQDGIARKFKPTVTSLFNILCRVPQKDGTRKLKLRVVRANSFNSWQKIMAKIKTRVEVDKSSADALYMFDDLEFGYWMDITLAKATATGGKGKPFMQITDITFKHKEEHKPVSDAVIKSIANLDLLIPQPPTYEEISAFMGNPATQASSEGELEEELVEEEEIVHTPPAKPAPAKATPAKKAAPAKKPEPKEEEETLLDDEESTEPTEEDGDVDEGDLDEIEGEEVVEEEETPPAPMKTPSGKTGKAPAKPIHDDLDKKPAPAPAKKGVAPTKAAPVKKAAPAPEPADEDEFGGDFNED